MKKEYVYRGLGNVMIIMFILIFMIFFIDGVQGSEVAVMHYGHFGGLSLTCQRDELILMESEVLGYSTNRGCNPQPLCSVPYTLAKWYCRGKSTCGGMQVERRPLHKRTCGSEFTNCLRVEYQCIPMSKLTDICSDTIYEAVDGYISSPDFPEMYPPDKNCTCSLTPATNEHVQIDTAFFLLKSSRPCHDWLRVTVDNDAETTRCGYIPEQKRYIGRSVNINFVSDGHDTEMGFWLRFTGTGGGPVKVRCGRYVNTDDTVTPSTKPPRPKTTRRLYKTRYTTKYRRKRIKTTMRGSTVTSRINSVKNITGMTTPELNNRAGRYSSTKNIVPVTETPGPENPRAKIEGKQGKIIRISTPKKTLDLENKEDSEQGMDGKIYNTDITSPENEDFPSEEVSDKSEDMSTKESDDFVKPTKKNKELNIIHEDEVVLEDKLHVIDELTNSRSDENVENKEEPDIQEGDTPKTEDVNRDNDMKPSQREKNTKLNNNQGTIKGRPKQKHAEKEGKEPEHFEDEEPSHKVKTFWTSPDYVDLDADYEGEEFTPIEMTPPHDLSKSTPVAVDGVTLTDGVKPSTDAPMIHFVHREEAANPTAKLKDMDEEENEGNPIKELEPDASNKDEKINMASETNPSLESNSEDSTKSDYSNSISEDYNTERISPDVKDGQFDTDNEVNIFGRDSQSYQDSSEIMQFRSQESSDEVPMLPPQLDGEYDEAILTGDLLDGPDKGFILNGEEDRILDPDVAYEVGAYTPENRDSTGRLLMAPTDFPQTIKDSDDIEQSQKPLPTMMPSSTTSGYGQFVPDYERSEEEQLDVTPHDWRLSLSKAGYAHEAVDITMDPFVKTTTPDEMLHYVHSGNPFTDKNSIATGEFHPVGDLISLIDEKDVTTTTTTTWTTTPPPEIFTLRGDLNPIVPLNTIGKGFKPLLIPARRTTTPEPTTSSSTERYYPTGPRDLAGLFDETPWRSFGVNTSWIPPMVLQEDLMIPPLELPTTEPPYNMPEAIRSTSANKDLMWVLIVIAIVLWVVFMALLAMLIYHRRNRMTCFRGDQPQRSVSGSQGPLPKNVFVPPLSAPMTPGFRRPCQHNSATQTGASRLASAMSWNSCASGPLINDHRPSNPSPTTLSFNDDSSRSISPASPTPSDIRAASTQTLIPSERNNCAVQTDISGTLRRYNASAKANSGNATTRRHAPLPPVPRAQNSPNNNHPGDTLRHVPPLSYAHTILRNIPGSSPTSGGTIRPPYAEKTTDLTTNDLNQEDNSWVTMDPYNPKNEMAQVYGSLPFDDRYRPDTPQQRPRAKTLNINTRPSQRKNVHRLSGLPPPPPPPDFYFGSDSPKSRKSSVNSSIRDQTYSTIKPRARPRASSASSQNSNIPGVNAEWSTADFLTSKWDRAQEIEPDSIFIQPPRLFLGDDVKKTAPVLSFPPPPPPTPPPLPSRRPSYGEASDEDNERSHPVGCEASDPGRDQTPPHLRRGKSTPNVLQDLGSETEEHLLMGNQDLLKGDSAPQLNWGDSPEEKLKGLVPQQAFFFNDKVQPELRRILSKRRFGSEPVQV